MDLTDIKQEFRNAIINSDQHFSSQQLGVIFNNYEKTLIGISNRLGKSVILQTAEVAFEKELTKVIDAGDKLAEAAHYLQENYDGIHRLRLALSNWYKVRADEFGRGESSLSV